MQSAARGTARPLRRLRGLDVLDKIGGIMFDEYKEKRYASPPLLKRMVSLGYFGRKSGKGFYDYSRNPPVPMPLV
jgi:3-hydroxybutyryl-CoA dehydrogenase